MYNPTYNQLQLINGQNCRRSGKFNIIQWDSELIHYLLFTSIYYGES